MVVAHQEAVFVGGSNDGVDAVYVIARHHAGRGGHVHILLRVGIVELGRQPGLPQVILPLGIQIQVPERTLQQLGKDELAVYKVILEKGEIRAEEIAFEVEMHLGNVQGILTILEMKGLVFSAMGKFFVAKY